MKAHQALIAVNIAGGAAAAAFAVRGLKAPNYVKPGEQVTDLARFWAASSAVRTWSTTVPLLAALFAKHGSATVLLTVAGAIQLGDSALGIWQQKSDMAVAPAMMGIVHLASARMLRAVLRIP